MIENNNNKNSMKNTNDFNYCSFMSFMNKGNDKNIMNENDLLIKIICNVYNKNLNNYKQNFELATELLNINKYSVNNTKQKNIELIYRLVNIIPLIMKCFKENLPNFSVLKKKFESKKNIIKNEALEEEIKIASQELSKLCDGIISSSSDIIQIFKLPLLVVNKYTQCKFNIIQFQKEEFYNLLIKDNFLCELRKDFEYVDKIIEILKKDFNIEKEESIKIKNILKEELSKYNINFEEKEKEIIMDRICFYIQNVNKKFEEIDIDDLVNYINAKDENKTKKKKKNKKNKKKKDNIINDNIINDNNNNYENKNNFIENKNNEEQKIKENDVDAIEEIKESFRNATVNAQNICKINGSFSKKWVSNLENHK